MTPSRRRREEGVTVAAIVGFGDIARFGHLPWYAGRSDVRLEAVVEPTPGGRAAARRALPDIDVFRSLHELLEARAVSFIDVTAPPAAHAELVETAVANGVHVICEKPFVMKRRELDRIALMRRPDGPVIAACHNWYHAPAIRRCLELVAAGRIGEPKTVRFTAHRPRPATGADHWKPYWRLSAAEGGGIIGDLGYHGTYLTSRVFGGAPVSVRAGPLNGRARNEAETDAWVRLDYGDGRRGDLSLSWTSDARETSLRIQGTAGAVTVNGSSLRVATNGRPGVERRFASSTADSWHAAWIADTLDRFHERVRAGDGVACWRDIERCVSTIDAARLALRDGGAVHVECPSCGSPAKPSGGDDLRGHAGHTMEGVGL